MLANLACSLFLSAAVACIEPPERIPLTACTTHISILIWSDSSDDVLRVTVPVDCDIARLIELDEPVTEIGEKIPMLFEQRSKRKDWHAAVQMKDFVAKAHEGE